jgi:penicillin-binding protein 1A
MAQRKFHREIYKESKGKKIAKICATILLSCFFIFVFSILGLFVYYAKELPRPEKFTERQFNETTKIYDRTGEILLYKIYGEEKRTIVPFSEISDNLKNAILIAEDKNFYNHHGIDFKGTARSISVNLKLKKLSQGGSTITQQLLIRFRLEATPMARKPRARHISRNRQKTFQYQNHAFWQV